MHLEDIKILLKKKNKKQEYDREQYKNLSDTEKHRKVECRKKII